jgi:hypothetical protein
MVHSQYLRIYLLVLTQRNMRRSLKGAMHSKTMWFSLAMVVLGSVYDNFSYLQNVIDPKYYGSIFIGIGVICAVLRFYTTLPLDKK